MCKIDHAKAKHVCVMLSSCDVVHSNGDDSLLVNTSLTVKRQIASVCCCLVAPLYVVTVIVAC